MDSVTQILLGASVGHAVLGRQVGRKAALWGAVCGTLPDLDVLVPFSDPVAAFTYHRSFSHSLFVLALLTPLIVWLIRKIHRSELVPRWGWPALVYLVFATHVLLDACTIYGTQIFWPLITTPMTWGSIFIIDPLYTLPLLIGVIAVILTRRNPGLGHRINLVMLSISTLYLAWSFVARDVATDVAEAALADQGIRYQRVVALASPFNTILWRIVVVEESGYRTGWYSLLDEDRQVAFTPRISRPELLEGLEDHWPVGRLQWFTRGFYGVNLDDQDIVVSDLRMGIEGAYVFRFKVGERQDGQSIPVAAVQVGQRPDFDGLPALWRRMLGDRSEFAVGE